jgi:hypothetical protein
MVPAIRTHSESIAGARAALTALATNLPAEAVAATFRHQLNAIPAGLLQTLLAEPDGKPATRLPHVPLSKYAAAVARDRRAQAAAQRWKQRVAQLWELLGPLPAAVILRVQETQAWLAAAVAMREERPAAEWTVDGNGAGDALQQQEAAEGAAAAPEPASAPKKSGASLPALAVLTLTGVIQLGSDLSPTTPGSQDGIPSLPVIKALREARNNPAIKAVVLRIDSPGGWLGCGMNDGEASGPVMPVYATHF